MWEENPNLFREVGDVTIIGMECFQLPAFPSNGIDPTTRDVAAMTDAEFYQIVTCISNGNECIVRDAVAAFEVNPSDSSGSIIIDNINNVLVPQLIDIVVTQSIVEIRGVIPLSDFAIGCTVRLALYLLN